MSWRSGVLAFALCCFSIGALAESPRIPAGELRLAYRLIDSYGNLAKVVSHLRFSCSSGHCSLVTTEFNSCSPGILGKEQSWFPGMRVSSTTDRSLSVRHVGRQVILIEERFGAFVQEVRTYKIGYQSNNGIFAGATSFSGSYSAFMPNKDNPLVGGLVALRGSSPKVVLDCTLVLDGLIESQ
jgi:hypothetical protein